MVRPSSAVVVSMSSALAVTLTVWLELPSFIWTFWVALVLASVTIPCCTYFAKPRATTVST